VSESNVEFDLDGLIADQSISMKNIKYYLPTATDNLVKESFAINQTKPNRVQSKK
jgi:hypothetical protein